MVALLTLTHKAHEKHNSVDWQEFPVRFSYIAKRLPGIKFEEKDGIWLKNS